MFKLKRVYETPSVDDGYRVLVERLWPRGISKEKAALDLWLKDIAPSPELRRWFGHDPAKWQIFAKRYGLELKSHADLLHRLGQQAKKGPVTLIYAASDPDHNSAVVLKKRLERSR